MRDIEIKAMAPDLRPALVLDDVEGADFMHIKLHGNAGPSFQLRNVKDFKLMQSRPIPDTYLDSVAQKIL